MKENNIETTYIKNDCILFQTNCTCSHPDHVVTVCVENDEIGSCVENDGIGSNNKKCLSVSMFFKCCWCDRYRSNLAVKIWERIKAAAKILFNGYLELEDTFTFRDEFNGTKNHLKDFRNALDEAIKHVEENT